jgi:pimeloyl-ACP methyl ester carboxylesterase
MNEKIKTVVVTIHGQESIGLKMKDLNNRLSKEDFMATDSVFINLRYERLLTISNVWGRTRRMTAKYIAARLNGICLEYPNARIIIIAHSNGTRAARIAMDMRLRPAKNWPMFRVDDLILLGCPIKRNYKWTLHPATMVYNFASRNDKVVWFARFYGMGTAGRNKFKHAAPNLKQYVVKWGHSGFMEQYNVIAMCMALIMDTEKISNGQN